MLYKRARTAIPVFEYQHKVTALSLDFILIKSMSCFFLGSFKNQALKFVFKSVQSQSLVQKMSRKVWFFSDLNSGSVWDWWPMLCHRFKVLCILSCASPPFAFRYTLFCQPSGAGFFDMYFKFLVECIFRCFGECMPIWYHLKIKGPGLKSQTLASEEKPGSPRTEFD